MTFQVIDLISQAIAIESKLAGKTMSNVSLVAFYGDKPSQLQDLIRQLQQFLTNHELIGDRFIPYQLEQVHATIIGCEGSIAELGIVNQWFDLRRQETRYMNLVGLVNYLQQQITLPLTIRFGGFDRATEYNFRSRNEHLYFRSFQLQPTENQAIPIFIGWSWENNRVTLAIDRLRRNLQQFNLLHKYHATDEAIDNDFYLRLGTIARPLNQSEIQTIATQVCNFLASQPPLYLPLEKNNLAFARYQDLSLSPATTEIIPISAIAPQQLATLYKTE